jgi:ribonuclease BN (tRNA processing enzyme)
MDTHLTPSRAARMARQANPGTLIITHVYPQLDSVALPDMLLRAGWTGETIIAHDGMVLNR